MPSNGHAGPVRFDQPEIEFVIKEVARAPSGKFEDSAFELRHNGHPVAHGDAAAVIAELRKRRAYTEIALVAMDFIDDRGCVYRHRDPGDNTSPIIWRSDQEVT